MSSEPKEFFSQLNRLTVCLEVVEKRPRLCYKGLLPTGNRTTVSCHPGLKIFSIKKTEIKTVKIGSS